jgi:signal transduction histidine kinase/FixJ family two-component response regulator
MATLRVLHLEDNDIDALLVRNALQRANFAIEIERVSSPVQFRSSIRGCPFDVILTDNDVLGFSGKAAVEAARQSCPNTPVIVISGAADTQQVEAAMNAGATDYILKDHLWQLVPALRQIKVAPDQEIDDTELRRRNTALVRLVAALQDLSRARDVATIITVVCKAARELTGADAAAFMLREDEQCYCAGEDGVRSLWKGQRFPITACADGWAMLNRQPAVIEDVHADPRIPPDVYRSTFVKGLLSVPIDGSVPAGAIGSYWAQPHRAAQAEVEVLQALANSTAIAMENLQANAALEQRVRDRTLQLEAANRELDAFSYSVSHDLRAPLRGINFYTQMFVDGLSRRDENAETFLAGITSLTRSMNDLIDNLMKLAKLSRVELVRDMVNLSAIAQEVIDHFRLQAPDRQTDVRIQQGLRVQGDAGLLQMVLESLLSNAWKFTARRNPTVIEFGRSTQTDGTTMAFFVRDNGAGFDMAYADRLFVPFQRLHSADEFGGVGIGLAIVQRIIHRHGGRVWAEAGLDSGATFFFTLPQPDGSS